MQDYFCIEGTDPFVYDLDDGHPPWFDAELTCGECGVSKTVSKLVWASEIWKNWIFSDNRYIPSYFFFQSGLDFAGHFLRIRISSFAVGIDAHHGQSGTSSCFCDWLVHVNSFPAFQFFRFPRTHWALTSVIFFWTPQPPRAAKSRAEGLIRQKSSLRGKKVR